jgi:putative ABC transport system substrate-binding protein
MRRRELLSLLGGMVVAAHSLRAQQKAMPVVGWLFSTSPPDLIRGPIYQGMSEIGFVEGQNMMAEYRWAEGHYERLPALAADLVSRKVDLIVTAGGTPPALAAKNATSTIPIVFANVADPIGSGLVASLSRPGGNLHRLRRSQPRADAQAARTALRIGSPGRRDRPAGEPRK